MTLNWVERLLVDNPVRALVQRRLEALLLFDLGGAIEGGRVLEIGCGRGAGVGILIERFGATHVCAIDLDLSRLPRARRPGASFIAGAAEHLPFPNRYFDAVFDFGVLHHVPDWQTAVAEVARVLKPGGRFYFEEVTAAALDLWIYRALLKHPAENRFDEARFLAELSACGLQCVANPRHLVAGDIFIGVSHVGSRADQLDTRAVIQSRRTARTRSSRPSPADVSTAANEPPIPACEECRRSRSRCRLGWETESGLGFETITSSRQPPGHLPLRYY